MKGGAHPSPFAALAFPSSKKVPIHCWLDRESFPVVAWQSPASNSQPYGDFLHHHRAALTTRLRRLSFKLIQSFKRIGSHSMLDGAQYLFSHLTNAFIYSDKNSSLYIHKYCNNIHNMICKSNFTSFMSIYMYI